MGGEDTIPLNLIPVTVGVSPNNCILNTIFTLLNWYIKVTCVAIMPGIY